MKKNPSNVLKACLAVIALSAAACSFAEVIDCTKTQCDDYKSITASLSALSAGGYELSVGRAFVVDGYQLNISLTGGSEQERSYVGLHVQSIPFKVVEGGYMRGGVGYAATSTSTDWRVTTHGGPGSSISLSTPAVITTGTGHLNSPFLSLELAHAVQPGVEAFVHAKYFSGFATHDSHEERTFAGVGLRTAF